MLPGVMALQWLRHRGIPLPFRENLPRSLSTGQSCDSVGKRRAWFWHLQNQPKGEERTNSLSIFLWVNNPNSQCNLLKILSLALASSTCRFFVGV